MGIEQKLRRLQDRLRNAGWRIQHIPWQPEGKPEYVKPNDPLSWMMVSTGLAGFLGGMALVIGHVVAVPVGVGIMVAGLGLLFASRFVDGFFMYRHFVRVDARCIDREVRKIEDPESIGSINRVAYWHPRILCEYRFEGRTYRVTPIIARFSAFRTANGVNRFLDRRIDADRRCTLWINPRNPLQSLFHKKPWMTYHG